MLLLSLTILACGSSTNLQFKVLGSFPEHDPITEGETIFVYVENFEATDQNWIKLEEFAHTQKAGSIPLQVFEFIHDSTNQSPSQIDVEDFRKKYAKHVIANYTISGDVEVLIKYPYKNHNGDK